MTNFVWNILEVFAKDGLITGCRYFLTGTEDSISVETEGNFYFNEPEGKVPFAEVTEEMIISWIEKEAIRDGKNHIKSNVEKQINALKEYSETPAPWMPQVFTPTV